MSFSNTDNFRESALHFKEYGKYTLEQPGTRLWKLFWERERKRCLEGLNLGYDNITDYHYNFLNYSPILVTEVVKETTEEFGQNQADRVEGFPAFWDEQYRMAHYIEECKNKGEHGFIAGSRGRAKSLFTASMCVRNYHHIRNSNSFCFASKEEFLIKDGIISKSWELMDFIDSHTPWAKRRHEINTTLHRKASVKIKNAQGIETIDSRSYKSQIIGVTVGDSIQKLRGKRGKLIILEEAGIFPNLKTGWNVLRPSMESGKNTFGLILGIGTGGGQDANFEGLQELFKNPRSYRIHPVKNTYDVGLDNTESGFFYPAYMNWEGAMDKDGNSDIDKAKKLREEDLKRIAGASDPTAVIRRKAELPFNLNEMMMRISGTKFPVDDLNTQLAELENNPHKYRNADYIGKLVLDNEGNVKWKPDDTLTPIYNFPHTDNKRMEGAVVIYEQPYTNNKEETPYGLYIAGIDGYDHDESTTNSLGNLWILNTLTDRLVLEYTGRPSANIFYETCRRALIYYNCVANPENANKGIITYFENKNSSHLLCTQPKLVRDIEQNTTTTLSRPIGTPPTVKINQYARTLIAEWLLTPIPTDPKILNYQKIRSIPLLKELIFWSIEGNYDRVSGLGMLMILRQDREKYKIDLEETNKPDKTLSYFFKNYPGYNSKAMNNNKIYNLSR